MTPTQQWIYESAEGARLVGTFERGRAWWIPTVGRYLIELEQEIGKFKASEEGDQLPSREVWSSALVVVLELLGGHDANITVEERTGPSDRGVQASLFI